MTYYADMNIGYMHEPETVAQFDKEENSNMDQVCRTYSIPGHECPFPAHVSPLAMASTPAYLYTL